MNDIEKLIAFSKMNDEEKINKRLSVLRILRDRKQATWDELIEIQQLERKLTLIEIDKKGLI